MTLPPAPRHIDLLKRLTAALLIVSRDPSDENEARKALESVEVLIRDCIELVEGEEKSP